ncbi:hypothetical protein BGX29_004453 [Mortierella sp. GBA35]|nr:hypothetical protein BGX23_010070 [Mortierella sp. AD031]KAF9107849.1 hypothetical protein BGX29_004453 [Mortierella sp. GBA35]KAG0212133.1 hypothetical protein BGX33_003862 [Mortierella sp. NVP41]
MSAPNTTVISPSTPWKKYFCQTDANCVEEGFMCHHGYCIPNLKDGETCKDPKDTVAPFVARVNNIYHLYCDMPETIAAQDTKCPLGCETWENCHSDICYLKKCTKDQLLCKQGQLDYCMGLRRDEIFCYEAAPHGNTHSNTTSIAPQSSNVTAESKSDSNVGAIAGGVSAAVVVVLAAGAFFLVRRRRAAKAAKAAAAAQSLPTYSSQDEKNAMSQVA